MKRKITMKAAYAAAVGIILVMLLLQWVLLSMNNVEEAKNTTRAYLSQAQTIIEKNKQEEEILLSSLKEEYVVLAKAVSYYLDHNPEAIDSTEELQKICSLMSIDDIYVFDATGTITAGSKPEHIGISMSSGAQISYFTPMLSDKSLTMCQDVTPNSAEGKPMVYAMTWNEAGTHMVQIGIEPERLLQELEANKIQTTVDDIALDDDMTIVVADASTLVVVGSTNEDYLEKPLLEVTELDQNPSENGFFENVRLANASGRFYCSTGYTSSYCVCVFLNHGFFTARMVESLIAVFACLILALFATMAIFRRLLSMREQNYQHLKVFQSMSEIYYSLHLVDLKKNTVVEYSSQNQVKDVFDKKQTQKADELMIGIMHATMSDEYLERGLEFGDMTTVAERMRNKKIISMELLGKNVGWIRMSFIALETEDGLPERIIIATQIIDEEKKKAESLYKKSHVDELTGCFNRRAYNADILPYQDGIDNDFAFISLDVNGLKTANDDLGHEAGDELICGAAECMKNAFLRHGKVYRTGGDEFIVLLHADEELLNTLCHEFDDQVSNWHGNLVDAVSISYGYVHSSEAQGKTITEIACLADQRMYDSKAKYYEQKGIDRRRT